MAPIWPRNLAFTYKETKRILIASTWWHDRCEFLGKPLTNSISENAYSFLFFALYALISHVSSLRTGGCSRGAQLFDRCCTRLAETRTAFLSGVRFPRALHLSSMWRILLLAALPRAASRHTLPQVDQLRNFGRYYFRAFPTLLFILFKNVSGQCSACAWSLYSVKSLVVSSAFSYIWQNIAILY